jgi:hypothetical protein
MGARAIERKLRKTSARLRQLRADLGVIDEQLSHLADDAEDKGVRAVVGDNPQAAQEYREAAGQSEAMAKHRRHVAAQIIELETRQDRLLDELRLR